MIKEKARIMRAFSFASLRFRAADCFCEARLLARRCVLLDNTGLRCLVDSLVGCGKGLFSLLYVRSNSLADNLGGVSEGALAAHVENVLLEGCAMRLLCVLRDCHCRPDSTAFREYAQEMLGYAYDSADTWDRGWKRGGRHRY